MEQANGLHHITAIAGDPQENLDFYAGVLGMRLVKKSVNQDDPGTYHLFYADAEGHPGSDLTFFPWPQLGRPRLGHGLAVEVSLEVPQDSLSFWAPRLERYGTTPAAVEERFGDRVLPLADPHGLRLALVESARPSPRTFTPWNHGPVPNDRQIRGLYGARLWERDAAGTATFLASVLGARQQATEDGWTRHGFDGASGVLDVLEHKDAPRGTWGVGSVHHLAFRVADESQQLAVRERVMAAGVRATPVIDRFWFKSVYFNEPGGTLFELATDGPGFAIDEDREHLGETLVLPPWFEGSRRQIEAALPPLRRDPRLHPAA